MLVVLYPFLAFLAASMLAALLGLAGARAIENANLAAATESLDRAGLGWVLPEADGMMVEIFGTAPDTAAQRTAHAILTDIFGSGSVRDLTLVNPDARTGNLESLVRFQKSGGSVILFGSVAGEKARQRLVESAESAFPGKVSHIMLQTFPGRVQAGWNEAAGFAVQAIAFPQVSLVEADSETVSVSALAESEEAGKQLMKKLEEIRPGGLAVDYRLASVPPPLVSPYTLRLEIQPGQSRFTVCHAESTADRDRILAAAAGGDSPVTGSCRLARGAPREGWAEAVETVVNAVKSSGGGVVSASGTAISVVPADGNAMAYLQNEGFTGLPEGFTVSVISPEAGDYSVRVTKGPDGYIEFDGAFPDETEQRATVLSTWAAFGASYVQDNSVIDPETDSLGSGTVLLAGEALNLLHKGSAAIRDGHISISGTTDDPHAESQISEMLSQRFAAGSFALNIEYDSSINAPPPPMDPQLCLLLLKDTQKQGKISFDPNSTRIQSEALDTIDQIVEVMQSCRHVPIEIAGHTDSQGGEESNQRLSERRAWSVLRALLDAGYVTKNIAVKGYGESQPIDDNSTEAGREANRRIEFRLYEGQPPVPQ